MTATSLSELSVDELLEREREQHVARRREWRDGYAAGLLVGGVRVLDEKIRTPAFEYLAIEGALLNAAYRVLCNELAKRDEQLRVANRIKGEALQRVVELARELDQRAPGWDRP